ncbi:MAG: hypothetical protein ACREI7_12690, partial [Myxococcota bacterium]
MLAYEEAAAQYRRALEALERCEVDEELRCDLLLDLGEARRAAGERPEARALHLRAAELARSQGLPTHLARAALGYCGRADLAAEPDPRMFALLEEALTVLDGGDSSLRASLLARLAVNLYFTPAHERRQALSLAAVEMAERLADPRSLAEALHARHYSLWGPDHLDERLTIASRLIELAEENDDREAAFLGHGWRFMDLLERGDLDAVDREIAAAERLADATGQAFYKSLIVSGRAMRALLEGRLSDAEALVMEGLALGEKAQTPN